MKMAQMLDMDWPVLLVHAGNDHVTRVNDGADD